MSTVFLDRPTVVYPDSDGQPMADNTRQYEYMVMIKGGLDILFALSPDVFVAGDHLWYPVEGHPEIRIAPDVYVAFGRPKGHRGSYKQWMEGGVAPQVAFEVLSPRNSGTEMLNKLAFYEQYGVQEYYDYDPDRGTLLGYARQQGDRLAPVPEMQGYVSPRLRVRFELADGELTLYGPDGQRFQTVVEWAMDRDRQRERADQERQRAEQAEQRAALLAAKLRESGIEPPP